MKTDKQIDENIDTLKQMVIRYDLDTDHQDIRAINAAIAALEQQRDAGQRVPEGLSDLYSVEWFKRENGQFEVTIWPDPESPLGGWGDTPMDAIRDALAASPEPDDG